MNEFNFVEKLNFSDYDNHNGEAIKLYSRNRDLDYYYDNLCLYCANNNIDISNVFDDDFMNAAEVMSDYGSADKEPDSYYFWID